MDSKWRRVPERGNKRSSTTGGNYRGDGELVIDLLGERK